MTFGVLSAIIRVKSDGWKQKMKNLRILFTIICAVCLAVLPIFATVLFNFVWIPLLLAIISFALMLYFKNKHVLSEQSEEKPVGDFFSPAPKATDSAATEGEQATQGEQITQDAPAQELQDA